MVLKYERHVHPKYKTNCTRYMYFLTVEPEQRLDSRKNLGGQDMNIDCMHFQVHVRQNISTD